MAIDRSLYKQADSTELQKESELIKSRESSSRGDFLKVEAGINVFRLFPAPQKAKSSLFCFPNVCSFLPFLVDEKDSSGKAIGSKKEVRKPIFNAKVHGGLERDIVEEYILFVKEKFSSTISDKKVLYEKLKALTYWETGVKPSSSWVAYACKKIAAKKFYGRIQITDGAHKQMDALCMRQGESGQPVVVDLFSHPDTGKMIQWNSDPQSVDAKNRNKISILFEQEAILTDEELEMLESWESLESLYKNSYTRSDFEKQLEGLQRFDAKNGYEVFESPSFQNIILACKEEIDEKLPEESTNSSETKGNKVVTHETTTSIKSEAHGGGITILEAMDKKTLSFVASKLELGLEIKATTAPTKLRGMIAEAIKLNYELSGEIEEINQQISEIIENSFEDEKEEDTPPTTIDSDQKEVSEEVKPQDTTKTRTGSLMDKYSKKQ